MSIAPDAVGAMPGLGGPGMPDPTTPPMPQDPGSMAALAALLQGGGGGGGLPGAPPGGDDLSSMLAGAAGGDDTGQKGTDLLSGMSSTEHIRAAIKHLMMAMTESSDEQESHGITKGMGALQGILAGKAKADATVTAAGGTPAGG